MESVAGDALPWGGTAVDTRGGEARRHHPRLRDAAAHDARLWRLAHAEAEADRELARGLASLWRHELYRPLGFVRATDFVREHLGIKEGRARWLARLGHRLRDIPELDHALASGRINASHVLELGRIVNSTTPAAERRQWIERAAGSSIRALRTEVRRELEKRTHADHQTVPADTDHEAEVEVLDLSAGADEHPEGGWMSIPAPARVAVLWHHAAELARAASGRHLALGQCAEMIFAEYLSALGNEAPEATASIEATFLSDQRQRRLAELMRAINRPRTATLGTAASRAWSAGEVSARSSIVDWQVPDRRLPEDCVLADTVDPWQLAATLKRLCELKQKLRYQLAGLLARLHHRLCWQALGFASFEHYCEQRLGFGLRRAERLIRFRSGLERFAGLKWAYLAGRVSYTAALLLLPILDRSTETRWVEWAAGVTYRELERAAEYARMYSLPGAHPQVLASWVRGLREQGLANDHRHAAEHQDEEPATAFDAAPPGQDLDPARDPPSHRPSTPLLADIPLGYALPPAAPGALPSISGFPSNLTVADPELCIARIRFWLPADALELAYRALRRCRLLVPNPLHRTWVYFQIILVHFIYALDTPAARDTQRRHAIIARDRFRCSCPGCTSRASLHDHHLQLKARGVCNESWNRTTLCAGHHQPGVHRGVVVIGGWAPHHLYTRLGIDPRTGRALASYHNERRVTDHTATARLLAWRHWWSRRQRHHHTTTERTAAMA
jgi:hypothetical protein